MAASQRFEVVLSLKDAEAVKRGLQSLGSEGERALKRIEQASTPASGGLQALDKASASLQGQMGGLSSRAGAAGTALEALGKGGLAAAAGLGAALLVVGKVMSLANEATKHFGDLADAAQRAGTSAEHLQVLQRAAQENGVSVEQLSTMLENLSVNISRAAEGHADAQKKFETAGISMSQLSEIGGDTARVYVELANNGASAASQADLMGKAAKGAGDAIEASRGDIDATAKSLRDLGLIASNEVVKGFDDLADKGIARINEEFAKWSPLLLSVAQGMQLIRQEAFNLLDALKPVIEQVDKFWKLRSAITSGESWQSPEAMRGALRKGLGIEPTPPEGGLTIELTHPNRAPIAIKPPEVRAPRVSGRSGGRSVGRPAEEPKLDLSFGKPFEDEIQRLEELSSDSLTKTQQDAQETMDRIVRANLEAHGEIVKIIEMDRDAQLRAIDLVAASEEDKAKERVLINDTANQKIAAERAKMPAEETQLTGWQLAGKNLIEFGDRLTSIEGISQGVISGISSIGATATSAFADAIVAGKGFEETLSALGTSIEKMLIQMTLQIAMQQAIGGAASGLGGLFMGPAAGPTMGGMGTTTSFGATLAKGGVIGAGPRPGVYAGPTIFPMGESGFHRMARGMGLLGERGPEAVVPLKRTSNGNLGVASAAPVVNVMVNNNTSSQVNEETRRGPGGEVNIILDVVERRMAERMARPGTVLNRAFSSASSPLQAR